MQCSTKRKVLPSGDETVIKTTVLPLLLLLPMFAAAQTTTVYYQNSQIGFRGAPTANDFYLPYAEFTAQNGDTLTVTEIFAANHEACNGQAAPYLGFLLWDGQPCSSVTPNANSQAVTVGPMIKAGSCSGPSSVHVAFEGGPSGNGGTYDAQITYYFARYGCYYRTLNGTLTLNN
jgi:hypothetical protein